MLLELQVVRASARVFSWSKCSQSTACRAGSSWYSSFSSASFISVKTHRRLTSEGRNKPSPLTFFNTYAQLLARSLPQNSCCPGWEMMRSFHSSSHGRRGEPVAAADRDRGQTEDDLADMLAEIAAEEEAKRIEDARSPEEIKSIMMLEISNLKSKAVGGCADSMVKLGDYLRKGRAGLPVNNELAVEWYKQAAMKRHPDGLYNLALCYMTGKGVKIDDQKTAMFLKEASKTGHVKAKGHLGQNYLLGQFGGCNTSIEHNHFIIF